MNNYTKEELQVILLDMDVYLNRTPMLKESPTHKALREKVQYMIDNYCEHEEIEGIPTITITNKCKKCKRII